MSKIRTRIAPSPTGFLHIGTARTALFNYLFAKHNDGAFVLRIEDTDLERSDLRYEKDIIEGLAWLGIEADESPEQDGAYGPYRQTERIEIYTSHLKDLLARGKAFYCFHSEGELEREKDELLAAKRPVLHLCEYRSLDPKEAKALKEIKQGSIVRFKTPLGRIISFPDLIRGELRFESDLLGDFSLAKREDAPLYNFAVVVDDGAMEISHVIRGEDHIANTPKQFLLIEALGFPQPAYAHLPLILGPDRSKLSKRHGATSVMEYKKMGYLPEALNNFMALLGWNPGDMRELLSLQELVKEFSLKKVQKAGAVFDVTKLDWMNGEYIRKTPLSELATLCLPWFKDFLQFSVPNSQFSVDYIEKIVALEQPRLKKLSEVGERTDYFFRTPEYDKKLLQWKQASDEKIYASLKKAEEIIALIKDSSAGHGALSSHELQEIFFQKMGDGDRGMILWPLRVALTGKKASPGPFEIIEILGLEETLRRIRTAQEKCGVVSIKK